MWAPKKNTGISRKTRREHHDRALATCLKSRNLNGRDLIWLAWDEASKPGKFRWFKPRLTQGSYKSTLNIRLAYRSSAHIFWQLEEYWEKSPLKKKTFRRWFKIPRNTRESSTKNSGLRNRYIASWLRIWDVEMFRCKHLFGRMHPQQTRKWMGR